MTRKKDLHELFHETLKDIYFARKQDPERLTQDGQGRTVGRPQSRV